MRIYSQPDKSQPDKPAPAKEATANTASPTRNTRRAPSRSAKRPQQLDKVTGGAETSTVHLDRGYDSSPARALLAELGFDGAIARKGVPAPIQAGTRWVVERAHAWMNGYGKLRRCTEKRQAVVDFYLFFAAALVGRPPAYPACPHSLSLAYPPHHAPPQVAPIAGHS